MFEHPQQFDLTYLKFKNDFSLREKIWLVLAFGFPFIASLIIGFGFSNFFETLNKMTDKKMQKKKISRNTNGSPGIFIIEILK